YTRHDRLSLLREWIVIPNMEGGEKMAKFNATLKLPTEGAKEFIFTIDCDTSTYEDKEKEQVKKVMEDITKQLINLCNNITVEKVYASQKSN
ncbi:MAG: hypothetical protein IJQ47_10695, partial [Synergistaceae bacterium]|nr:hypothetical protein [Synergistaceae bacterium]